MYPTEQEAIEHTAALIDSRDDALTLIAALRAQLATADEIIGGLVGAIAQARAAEDALLRDGYTTKRAADEEDAQATVIIAENAARAWLRREATK